jgi:hypothetical protein
MAGPARPLLISRPPIAQQFRKLRSIGGGAKGPGKARQLERLEPQFSALRQMLEAQRAALQTDPGGPAIEQVLVFETNGPIKDLFSTIKRAPGLEWLADEELRDLPPDEDFFVVPRTKRRKKQQAENGDGGSTREPKLLTAQLYLILFNQEALEQLLALWGHWRNGRLPREFQSWRPVFAQLRNVRRWDVQDRLQETRIIDYWRERLAAGYETVTIEIELWFRSPAKRTDAEQEVRTHVVGMRGQVLATCAVEAIAYHAVVARLPIAAVERILENPEVELLRCEHIRIMRPTAQAAAPIVDEAPIEDEGQTGAPLQGAPVIALLDGLPLENHHRLIGKLVVDDPEGWAETYPVASRCHGTAMASLILHGDLNVQAAAATRPLYARPILRPDSFDGKSENAPEQSSWLDLIHRAVRRILAGDGDQPPAAPSVCVINLSIGDPYQPFIRTVSPLARLLDWLAWTYKVLFVVSAGNHGADLTLDTAGEDSAGALLTALAEQQRHRRILSPSEAANALTVGAIEQDFSGAFQPRRAEDHLFELPVGFPSPISGLGRGYRRMVKPEVLAPGGRVVFLRSTSGTHGEQTYTLANPRPRFPPGHLVAAPGLGAGAAGGVRYVCGTSNAAALTTRLTAELHETLTALRDQPNADELTKVPMALWLKALVVHGACWSSVALAAAQNVLRTKANHHSFTDELSAILGYGPLDPQRVLSCTAERATVLAAGNIGPDQRFVHRIPLPESLNAHVGWRRLTLTLAWFTPINPTHQKYRCASLWFDPPGNALVITRSGVDWRAVRRGTLQHETLEGDGAAIAIGTDAILEVPVSCVAEAGALDATIPYALIASLEVAPGVNTRIYDQVRERIAQQVSVRPAPSPLANSTQRSQ